MVDPNLHASWISASGRTGALGLPQARFPYWSFTKTVIAACALILADKGALSLDAKLTGQAFSLRQLLGHVAGLPDYAALDAYHAAVSRGEPAWSRDRLLATALRPGMLFAPGNGWAYSNIGYLLARERIEEVTAQPLGAVVSQLICHPLGLTTVELWQRPEQSALLQWDAAKGYDPGWVYHGCLIGSAADAARLAHALFAGALLPAKRLGQMLTAHPLGGAIAGRPWTRCGYGLGVMSGEMRGPGVAIGHSGGGPFSVNAVYHFPNRPDPVTVACFTDGTDEGVAEFAATRIAMAT